MSTEDYTTYSNAKELLNKLSAKAVKISSIEVDSELENAREQLMKGLLIFNEVNVTCDITRETASGDYGDLVDIVGCITGVSKKMALKILKNYLMYEFRGAGDSIKEYIENKERKEQLIEDIWLCFLKEQIFLLHVIKLVWVYRNVPEHPYQQNFRNFVATLNVDNLLDNLILQSERLALKQLPQNNPYITILEDSIIGEQWCKYKLWGQIILTHIVLEIISNHQISIEKASRFFYLYKAQHFGFNLNMFYFKEHHYLYKLLAAAQSSIMIHLFLQAPFVDSASQSCYQNLKESMDILQAIDFQSFLLSAFDLAPFSNNPSHSDLSLLYKSMQCNPFLGMTTMLQCIKEMNDQPIEDRIYRIALMWFIALENRCNLDISNENSSVFDLVATFLSNHSCCQIYFDDPSHSLRNIVNYAHDMFPYLQRPLMLLVTGFAKGQPDCIDELMGRVENLQYYTEELTSALHACGPMRGGGMILQTSRQVNNGLLNLPIGIFGRISHIESMPNLVHWQIEYNIWDIFFVEIQKIAETMRRRISITAPEKLELLLDCIIAVLQVGHLHEKMNGAIQEVFEVADCLSQHQNNYFVDCQYGYTNFHLLSKVLDIFTSLMQTHSQNVCLSASGIKIIPYCKLTICDTPTVHSKDVDYGLMHWLFMEYDCANGSAEYLKSYINFLLEAIKYPDVPPGIIQAGIIAIHATFLNYIVKVWKFEKQIDQDNIYILCLNFARNVMNLQIASSCAEGWQKFCVEAVFWDTSITSILRVAMTGERNLENKMLDQSSLLTGCGTSFARTVQSSLSVLNLALQKRHLMSGTDKLHLHTFLYNLNASHRLYENNIYVQLANYLHCSFHPEISTLAIRLLQQIFDLIPMSLHAYMGESDDTIHQMFALRLLAEDEYPFLRTAIIDLIASCCKTDTQCRLMEVFFFIKNKNKTATSRSREIEPGILEFFLGVVYATSQDTTKVHNAIYLSVVNLMRICWARTSHFISAKMKASENFWKYFFVPLHHNVHDSTAIPGLLNIISYEAMRTKDGGKELDEEIKYFMENTCLVWNKHLLDSIMDDLGENTEPSDDKVKHLKAWSIFLVMMLKQRKHLMPLELLNQLATEFLDVLLQCLKVKFDSPQITVIAEIFIHLIDNKDIDVPVFTPKITKLAETLRAKYVYLSAASRTLLLSIVARAMIHKCFSMPEVRINRHQFVTCFGDMMKNETVDIPKLTFGKPSCAMLYACILQLLKIASPYYESINNFGASNLFPMLLINVTRQIKARVDLLSADIGMQVVVAASANPILIKYLIVTELDDLFLALSNCKHGVDFKDDLAWENIYDQGTLLCINLMTKHPNVTTMQPALTFQLATRFVSEHQNYMLDSLKYIHNRLDRKGLLIILHNCRLFNKLCGAKSVLLTTRDICCSAIMSAQLICVDLCILFLTRPKITITSFPEAPVKEDDLGDDEKNRLLLDICCECLECLVVLSSPDMTSFQQSTLLLDERKTMKIILDNLHPSPSLARDYQPVLSFGHLLSLCQYCIHLALKLDKTAQFRDSSKVVLPDIARRTIDACFHFMYMQAKAHCEESVSPAASVTFIHELAHEMRYIIDDCKRKLTSKSTDISYADTENLPGPSRVHGTLSDCTPVNT